LDGFIKFDSSEDYFLNNNDWFYDDNAAIIFRTGSVNISSRTAGTMKIGAISKIELDTRDVVALEDLNVSKNLNVGGNLTFYAEAYYHNHTATPLNFDVDGLFYNLSFNKFNFNGFSKIDNSTLLCEASGKYLVNYMGGGSGQNNHIYYTTILVNGIEQDNLGSHKKMSSGGDIITMSGSGFVNLLEGDYINLGTSDNGNTGTGDYYSSNLNLVRIGN